MTFTDLAKSHARTVIPFLVGLAVSLGVRAGVDLNGYAPELTVAVGWAYYAAARALEHYVSPRFGWLLGVATAPAYAADPPAPAPVVVTKAPVVAKSSTAKKRPAKR